MAIKPTKKRSRRRKSARNSRLAESQKRRIARSKQKDCTQQPGYRGW